MPRTKHSTSLFVSMNGKAVGLFTRHANTILSFQYHPEWLQDSLARPISLSLPLQKAAFKGDIVNTFFDNLLPDSLLIRERLQAQVKAKTRQPFELLSHIGIDCVGALQLSQEPEILPIIPLEAEPLSDTAIASILKDISIKPLGLNLEKDFRISLAGVQDKTALLWKDNKWWLPKRATPTTHILKLPIGYIKDLNIDLINSVENEWLCHLIAKAYRLRVANCTITMFKNKKALVVERFDRKRKDDSILRLPQEDLCQALGYSGTLKYENDGGPGIESVMKLLLSSQNAIEDRNHFLRTQVVFFLLAAIDGHAKNFSIFLLPGGRFQLTPLYDIISAHPILNPNFPKEKIKMAMALRGKNTHYRWDKIMRRHFISTAERCQHSPNEMFKIIDEVVEMTPNVIVQVRKQLPANFPFEMAHQVLTGIEKACERLRP